MFHSRWDNENQRRFPPTFRRVPNNIVLGFPEFIQRNTSSMSQNSKELSKKGAKKPETYSKHSLHALRAAITSSSVRMIVPGTACTVMLVEIAFAIRGIAAKGISCVRPFSAAIWAALALPLSLPLPLAEVSSDGNRSSKVFISRALLASHVVTFSVPALYCLYVSKRKGSIAILILDAEVVVPRPSLERRSSTQMRCASECGRIQLSDTRNGFQKLVGKPKLSRRQGDRIESKTAVPIRWGFIDSRCFAEVG